MRERIRFSEAAKGFTLLEILLYSAILGIVGLSLTGFFSNIYDYYYNVQIKGNVEQSLRYSAQVMQQAIRQAISASSTGSLLTLTMATSSLNPTVFGLDTNAGRIYQNVASGGNIYISPQDLLVTNLSFSSVSSALSKVQDPYRWAWSGGASSTSTNEGVGWIDFGPSSNSVGIPLGAGDLYGMAYVPSSGGYFSLNCVTTNSCSTVSYKVYEDASWTLRGWAWSDRYGWLSFNSADTTSTVPYAVSIASSTGYFSGYAWSENIGWVSFNCSNDNSCGTSNYKVRVALNQATPVNAIQISITMQSRAAIPQLQFSDTYTFSVPFLPQSTVRITGVSPSSGSGIVTLTSITGTGFASGATTHLSRSGFHDIFPTTECTFVSPTSLQTCAYDVSSAQKGYWDLVVTNPDGQTGILPRAFQVQ